MSNYGVGPTEDNVRAVLEANRPSTPTEARSFLCMAGFSTRFIANLAIVAEPSRAISSGYTLFGAVRRRNRFMN